MKKLSNLLAWLLLIGTGIALGMIMWGCASPEPSNPLTVAPVSSETVAPVDSKLRIKNAHLWWQSPYHKQKDSPWDAFVPQESDPLEDESKHFEEKSFKWPKKMPPAYKPEKLKEPKKEQLLSSDPI